VAEALGEKKHASFNSFFTKCSAERKPSFRNLEVAQEKRRTMRNSGHQPVSELGDLRRKTVDIGGAFFVDCSNEKNRDRLYSTQFRCHRDSFGGERCALCMCDPIRQIAGETNGARALKLSGVTTNYREKIPQRYHFVTLSDQESPRVHEDFQLS
jgi:hypothetical protein